MMKRAVRREEREGGDLLIQHKHEMERRGKTKSATTAGIKYRMSFLCVDDKLNGRHKKRGI